MRKLVAGVTACERKEHLGQEAARGLGGGGPVPASVREVPVSLRHCGARGGAAALWAAAGGYVLAALPGIKGETWGTRHPAKGSPGGLGQRAEGLPERLRLVAEGSPVGLDFSACPTLGGAGIDEKAVRN
jgi:hypothetical protein